MLKRLVTLSSLPNHLGTIASAGIVTLVVWLAAADDARLGAYLPLIATFYLGTQRLLPSVAEIVQEGMKIASNAAVLSDYQVSKPAPIRSHPVPSSDPLVAGTLAFDSLTLRYGDRGAALNDVSLEIPIGKTTVVLGPSGSGKSSLLNILLGLNEPTEGNVLINGLPLRTLPLRAWRAAIGFVPQEPFFFYGTIRANIDFGRGVSSESVETAARLADAEGFIKDLPNGFETILGERGHGLSGGEAQRICIARALIGSPALLVLDEPTSSLDRLSERAVLDSLRALSGHYTLIVVTHRTELVRAADQIVVMKDGSITALGTHQHLMKAHSDYQGLIGDSIKQDESKETRDGGARRR
jgi:ABC-type multidrug transport system fused ATPase/permease subunit